MNNEIKEILKCMKNYGSTTELALLDYITNLQQENERLNDKLNDTERRIKKAIEFIEHNYFKAGRIKDLLNILQNGSEKDDK